MKSTTTRSSVTPRTSTSTTTKTTKSSTASKPVSTHNDPNLIVTRGLQEILENDRKKKGTSATPRPALGRPPKTILCYLCGKGFGTASIGFHRPQCYLKQLIAWERGERRDRPVDPDTHERDVQEQMDAIRARDAIPAKGSGRSMSGKDHKSYSDADWEMYNQIQQDTAFSPCPNCGRTFLPDRLEVHLRSCKPGHTARPVRGKNGAEAPAPRNCGGSTAPPSKTNTAAANASETTPPSTVSTTASTTAADASLDERPLPVPRKMPKEKAKNATPLEAYDEVVSEESSSPILPPPCTASLEVGLPSHDQQEGTVDQANEKKTVRSGKPTIRSSAVGCEPAEEDVVIAYECGVVRRNVLVEHTVLIKKDYRPEYDPQPPLPPLPSEQTNASSEHDRNSTRRKDPSSSTTRRTKTTSGTAGESTTTTSIPVSTGNRRSMADNNSAAAQPQYSGEAGTGNEDEGEVIAYATGVVVENNRVLHYHSMTKDTPETAPEHPLAAPPIPFDTYSGDTAAGTSTSTPSREPQDDNAEVPVAKPVKRVSFNNVSHYKNVKSKLQLNKQPPGAGSDEKLSKGSGDNSNQRIPVMSSQAAPPIPSSSLCPCQYCNRTFNPDRIAKHESVCTERKKKAQQHASPPPASASTKSGSKTATTPRVKTTTSTILKRKAAADKTVLYCGDCGAKLLKEGQVFCNACGMKTA